MVAIGLKGIVLKLRLLLRPLLLIPGTCLAWPAAGTPPAQFGGPDSVSAEINRSYDLRKGDDAPPGALEYYFDWKKQLNEDSGLSLGLHGYWLYQNASETPGDENEGFGQIYRFLGSYTGFARDTGHPGRIEWRVEHRSNIGSDLSPSELGGEISGPALDPAFFYNPSKDQVWVLELRGLLML
jgi:hypothetical protein